MQTFCSTVNPQNLNVEQHLTLTLENPDPDSPIAKIHMASDKFFAPIVRNPWPAIGITKHQIFVVGRDSDNENDRLIQTLTNVVPSAACFCDGKVCSTEIQIPDISSQKRFNPSYVTQTMTSALAFAVCRLEGEHDVPEPFTTLCEHGVVSKDPRIANAVLGLAEYFYIFSRSKTMVAKGHRPFHSEPLLNKAAYKSNTP